MGPLDALPIFSGLLGGLFGQSQPELPPEVSHIYRFLAKLARERYQFGRSIPGSLPIEQATLAQAKGLAGQDQFNSRQNLLAALGPNAERMPGTADALSNFASAQSAQNAGLDSNMLLQFLQSRQNAPLEAAGIAQGAGGLASGGYRTPPGADFSQLFSQLGYLLGQRRSSPFMTPPITGVQQGTGAGQGIGGAAGGIGGYFSGGGSQPFGASDWGSIGAQPFGAMDWPL